MKENIELSLHRTTRHIEEDLEYYFSEQRDKHNQIRPADDISPCTPEAPAGIDFGSRAEPGNLFFPHACHSLQRIFIGISFPLYANSWGTAFLRHLLELIRPDGAVILPVYPEMQAHEKGLWCRSSLENIFRSRSRLAGISNIWAENDGVMSMRVRRKWPAVVASTGRWLWQQGSRDAWRTALRGDTAAARESWQDLCARHWRCAQTSAIGEQILRDCLGARRKLCVTVHGKDSGLLALELLFSPYLRMRQVRVYDARENERQLQAMEEACATGPHGTLEYAPAVDAPSDAVFALDGLPSESALSSVPSHGIVVCAPGVLRDGAAPSGFTVCERYSTQVATQLREQPPIHHYSMQIEEKIAAEAAGDAPSFAVLRRT